MSLDALNMTDSPPRLRVSLLVICFNRADEVTQAVASVQGCGFDEIVVLDNGSEPPVPPIPGVTWIRSDENLGVVGGRNEVVRHSSGDVIVFLDDDAVLRSPSSAAEIARLFAERPRLGVVGGLTRRPGGAIMDEEFPFRSVSDIDRARPAPYFIECIAAMRRTAWDQTGGYDPAFFYAHEGIDLSMRMERRGWEIVFDPTLEIEHRPSTAGRQTSTRVRGLRLRNRLVYVRRYLPWPIAVVHATIWLAHTCLGAGRRGVGEVLRLGREGLRAPVERDPLSLRESLALHRRGWRIFW